MDHSVVSFVVAGFNGNDDQSAFSNWRFLMDGGGSAIYRIHNIGPGELSVHFQSPAESKSLLKVGESADYRVGSGSTLRVRAHSTTGRSGWYSYVAP